MELENQSILEKEERYINHRISEISQTILDFKKINIFPRSLSCVRMQFLWKWIHNFAPENQHYQISHLKILTENNSLKNLGHCLYYQWRRKKMTKGNQNQKLDKPKIITSMGTKFNNLYSVSCRNDNEIWTHGLDNIMRLYHLQGIKLESITTQSLNEPYYLTVKTGWGTCVHRF